MNNNLAVDALDDHGRGDLRQHAAIEIDIRLILLPRELPTGFLHGIGHWEAVHVRGGRDNWAAKRLYQRVRRWVTRDAQCDGAVVQTVGRETWMRI